MIKTQFQGGLKDETQLNVRAADVEFVLSDNEGATFRMWSTVGHQRVDPIPSLQAVLQQDLQTDKRLMQLMHTGRRFFGIEVQVAWNGPFKGTRGVVVGDHDDAKRSARMARRKDDPKDCLGIIAIVQKEGSNERFDMPVKQLLHVH